MKKAYATVNDVISRYHALTSEEMTKAEQLLDDVSSMLRLQGAKVNKDLDSLSSGSEDYAQVLKTVTCDVVIRRLEQDSIGKSSTLSQESQSALGYSWSGTYVNTGGGLFIKKSELDRLGLRPKKIGMCNIYGF